MATHPGQIFEPPYCAVIFTSIRASPADDGYGATSDAMVALASAQEGYLGHESARGEDGLGITVSYWRTEGDAQAWKRAAAHVEAQRRGRAGWYASYRVRVARVEREYGFDGAR